MKNSGTPPHAGGGGDNGGENLWLETNQDEDLLDVDDSSIFYTDFPPLPDFPCMSSSSSSSSVPVPPKPIASSSSSSSSSSAASWALLKSDAEESYHHHDHQDVAPVPPPAEAAAAADDSVDCMDVMETFGYMELIDSNEIWDPSSIFQTENPQAIPDINQHEEAITQQQQNPNEENYNILLEGNSSSNNEVNLEQKPSSDELGTVFFEWLKSNKEYISADDMRNIKLKRATVESASKRLGSTKEGRKQLLKLILEWVEQYQLQKKAAAAAASSSSQFHYPEPFQNPNPSPVCNSIPPPDMNPCFIPASPWPQPPPPPYATDPVGFSYGGDLYSGGCGGAINYPPHSAEYPMLESVQTWPPSGPSQYTMAAAAGQYNPVAENIIHHGNVTNVPMGMANPQGFSGYGTPYPYQHQYYPGNNNGEKLVRLGSSATKEARKKRMARQRRFLSHHRHHHNHNNHHQQNNHQNQNQNQNQNAEVQQLSFDGGENCLSASQANAAANWVYWPNAAAAGGPSSSSVPAVASADAVPSLHVPAADRPNAQAQNCQQRQVSSERRQGWKPEKNLKFLLQKVLKQSDVGNLGRIVLPKKEAETHLPELEARDGIPIAMEDIGTSQVWNMRYRFWPNNKSRMYLLENTGDFVRANGLQEGDFIVIYSDVKCGKYLIRGVKVRQPGPKSEAKKPSKSHKNQRTASASLDGNDSSSQPSQRE